MTRHSSLSRLAATAALLAAVTLAAGCGGGDSARDDALGGLDRATEAADLQGEMAELVAAIPDDTAQAGAGVETQLADIDGRASDLIADADTGTDYDEQIASAATDTRDAGSKVTGAIASAQSIDEVRPQVVSSLMSSGEQLGSATTLIGTELEDDNGELSAEDAEALEATLAVIDESDQAVAAVSDVRDLVFDPGGVGNLRIGMTFEEAQAATGLALETSPPVTERPCVSYSVPSLGLGGIAEDGTTIESIGIDTSDGPSASRAQTTEGVGIGSSIAEFEAAYPGLVQQEETVSVGTKFSVEQPDGIIVFSEWGDGSVSFLGVGPGALALEGCL